MNAERGRRITFQQACERLGIYDENDSELYSNTSEDENESSMDVHEGGDQGDLSFRSQSSFEEEGEDMAEDISVFEEDAEDRDEDAVTSLSEEEEESDGHEYVAKGIHYREQCLPPRRRRRNILTENPRPLINPASETEAFECFMSEEILRTILTFTNTQ